MNAKSCNHELVRKLVFDGGLYANSTVHEAARDLQTIHKGRASVVQ